MGHCETVKKCSVCGKSSVYVQDIELTKQRLLMDDFTQAALYRCQDCGHFDLYEREEDRRQREEAERQAALPDYCCPSCGRVGKGEYCPLCRVACEPVSAPQKKKRD